MTTDDVIASLAQDHTSLIWTAWDFITDRDITDKAGYLAECLRENWEYTNPTDDVSNVDWWWIAVHYLYTAAAQAIEY